MFVLTIHLLGKFSARLDEQELKGLGAYRAQELFCYLLMHRGRPHQRETLAEALWGEGAAEKSKKHLRQALWHLQTALVEPQGQGASAEMLTVGRDWVQLNACEGIWLDVSEFERAFSEVEATPGKLLGEAQAEALRAAVALYSGDLLEGCYQDWCLFERERLQNAYLLMLDKLVAYSLARGEFERGQTYGALLLRHDRARERAHRQMMRMQYLSGDRTAALRQFERCTSALEEELGVEPDRRTLALYRQIRADNLDSTQQALTPEDAPADASEDPNPGELLGRLRRLQHFLDDVQKRIRKEIGAIEAGGKHL